VALRILQRRPWLHRVAGRSVLVGDIPWVAQAVEAFASKCFALSYSISTASFSSANPNDHLVHRHTHRVVRGSLLAIGRPNGKLNSLTTSEAACCLSLNQASSIQNMGVTCESITIGHNPFKLPLSSAAITLPTKRLSFISEMIAEGDNVTDRLSAISDGGEVTPSRIHSCSRQQTPLATPDTSMHGGQSRTKYLSHSMMMDAIAHGGAIRCGDTRIDAYVNPPSRDSSKHGGGAFFGGSMLGGSKPGSIHAALNTLGGSAPGSTHSELDTLVHGGLSPAAATHRGGLLGGTLSPISPRSREGSLHGGSRHRQYYSPVSPSGARTDEASSPLTGRNAQPGEVLFRTRLESLASRPILPSDTGAEDRLSGGGLLSTAASRAAQVVSQTASPPQRRQWSSPPPSPPMSCLTKAVVTASLDTSPLAAPTVDAYEQSPIPKVPTPKQDPPRSIIRGGTKAGRRSSPMPRRSKVVSALPGVSPNSIRATLDKVLADGTAACNQLRHQARRVQAFKSALELLKIEPIEQPFYGAWMVRGGRANNLAELMTKQQLLQQLNETRFDSMQRLVAFFVLFHKMAKDVQDFWPRVSFGIFGYDMSKTQSMLRIASTASPVSGHEVRDKMIAVGLETRRVRAASAVQRNWRVMRGAISAAHSARPV
jgi:hypothetical protein